MYGSTINPLEFTIFVVYLISLYFLIIDLHFDASLDSCVNLIGITKRQVDEEWNHHFIKFPRDNNHIKFNNFVIDKWKIYDSISAQAMFNRL